MASTHPPEIVLQRWRDLIARLGGDPSLARAVADFGGSGEPAVDTLLSRLSPARHLEWQGISSPERRQEWLRARSLELALEEDLGQGVLTSVSHTGGAERAVIAVGYGRTGSASPVEGVGVDLESAQRSIDVRVGARLLTPEESQLGLGLLESWVIKEACFKSVPGNEGTVLPDYRITQWDPASGSGKVLPPTRLGQRVCFFDLIRMDGGWVVGIAASRFSAG